MKKVLIYGSGSIGMLFAVNLSFNNMVYLLSRNKEQIDLINNNGIILNKKIFKNNILCISENDMGKRKYDLIIVAIPDYEIKSAVNEIKKVFREETHIISVQNGLYPHRILRKVFGKNYVKCVTMESSIKKYGNSILSPGKSVTYIENRKNLAEFFNILNNSMVKVEFRNDLDEIIFNKFIFYSLISSICCIENKDVKTVLMKNKWRKTIYLCLKEIGPIFGKMGIKVIDDPFPIKQMISCSFDSFDVLLKNMAQQLPKNIIPSFLHHYRSGKETEADYLIKELIILLNKNNMECNVLLSLYRDLYKLLYKENPKVISWRVTYECNLNCSYCSNIRPDKRKVRITLRDIYTFFRFVDYCKIKAIILNGGEPLLFKYIKPVIRELNKRNLYKGVVTNGTLIGKYMNYLKHFDYIGISLDSVNPKINDTIRGKNTTKRVLRNLINLLKINKNVDIMIVLTPKNKAGLFNTIKNLIELNVAKIAINPIRTYGPSNLSKSKISRIVEQLKNWKSRFPDRIDPVQYFEFFKEFVYLGKRPNFKCFSNKFFIKVDPRGNVLCSRKNFNIFKDDFSEYKPTFYKNKKCEKCFCNRDVINLFLNNLVSYEELPDLTKRFFDKCLFNNVS